MYHEKSQDKDAAWLSMPCLSEWTAKAQQIINVIAIPLTLADSQWGTMGLKSRSRMLKVDMNY